MRKYFLSVVITLALAVASLAQTQNYGSGTFIASTQYQTGAFIVVNGQLWECNTNHTSAATFSADLTNWTAVDADTWTNGASYPTGAVVLYGGAFYLNATGANTGNPATDTTDWTAIASVATGLTQTISQTGIGSSPFAIGSPLCYTAGAYAVASQTCSNVIGIISTINSANSVTITTLGQISGLAGLTPGSAYYLGSGGLASGTYTSGITATGSAGQTCTLTAFNNGNSGGTATVALTGTNAIAASTPLVITAAGTGNTAASTSATAGSGTATCSGTAVVSTTLSAVTSTAPVTGVIEQVYTATSATTAVVNPFANQAVASQYMHGSVSASITTGITGVGYAIPFNTLDQSAGSQVSLNTTTGTITIQPGGQYALRGSPQCVLLYIINPSPVAACDGQFDCAPANYDRN